MLKNGIKAIAKFALYLLPPALFVGYLFWPLYQKIAIKDSERSTTQNNPTNANVADVKTPLDFPIDEEYLPYFLEIPTVRHNFCFSNFNHIYLVHSDSSLVGFPLASPDLSQNPFLSQYKVGAMAIVLNYDNPGSDRFYREIGQSYCEKFDLKKINHLASSTIEYRHASLKGIMDLAVSSTSKVTLTRSIGNTFVETELSKATIQARWPHFIIVLILFMYGWIVFIKKSVFKNSKPN